MCRHTQNHNYCARCVKRFLAALSVLTLAALVAGEGADTHDHDHDPVRGTVSQPKPPGRATTSGWAL